MLEKTGVPEIQKAVVILHEMSADERVQEMARLREKWILDENSAMKNAERRGIKQGIEKGREEERNKIIASMRVNGMTEEQINKILKL